MKKFLTYIALVMLVSVLAGCLSDDAKADNSRLQFVNSSHYAVSVIPLTTEWSGFILAPGEEVKLEDIRDADFRYEPEDLVQEGSASTERYIVFVDAPPVPVVE